MNRVKAKYSPVARVLCNSGFVVSQVVAFQTSAANMEDDE
jgi:hypothetical protein